MNSKERLLDSFKEEVVPVDAQLTSQYLYSLFLYFPATRISSDFRDCKIVPIDAQSSSGNRKIVPIDAQSSDNGITIDNSMTISGKHSTITIPGIELSSDPFTFISPGMKYLDSLKFVRNRDLRRRERELSDHPMQRILYDQMPEKWRELDNEYIYIRRQLSRLHTRRYEAEASRSRSWLALFSRVVMDVNVISRGVIGLGLELVCWNNLSSWFPTWNNLRPYNIRP